MTIMTRVFRVSMSTRFAPIPWLCLSVRTSLQGFWTGWCFVATGGRQVQTSGSEWPAALFMGQRGWLHSFVEKEKYWRCRHPSPSGSPGPPFALLVLPWLHLGLDFHDDMDRGFDYDRGLDYAFLLDSLFSGAYGDFFRCAFAFGADLRAAAPGGREGPKGPRISTGDALLVGNFYDVQVMASSWTLICLQHALRLRAGHRAAAPGGRVVPQGPRKSTGDAQLVGFS